MKKTAMQIMLDELLSHGYKIPFHLVVKCKELLEMEKEQMENASCGYIGGWEEGEFDIYYKETYGGNNAD